MDFRRLACVRRNDACKLISLQHSITTVKSKNSDKRYRIDSFIERAFQNERIGALGLPVHVMFKYVLSSDADELVHFLPARAADGASGSWNGLTIAVTTALRQRSLSLIRSPSPVRRSVRSTLLARSRCPTHYANVLYNFFFCFPFFWQQLKLRREEEISPFSLSLVRSSVHFRCGFACLLRMRFFYPQSIIQFPSQKRAHSLNCNRK